MKELKGLCCKCGDKQTNFDKLFGTKEWWYYDKKGNIYCKKCSPKNSRTCFIGMFLKYRTNTKL